MTPDLNLTDRTRRALERVAAGQTAYAAAKAEGIALSTIYRAIKRVAAQQKTAQKAVA